MNFDSTEVLGKRYRLVQKKLGGDYGHCFPKRCKIVIDPTANAEQQKDTLLHEVIHAIDSELATGMKERQVRLLATGLMEWMRANQEIVRWISEKARV